MTPDRATLWGYLTKYAASAPGAKLLGEGEVWLNAEQARRLAVKTTQSVPTALWPFALSAVGAVAVLCDPKEDPAQRCAGVPIRAVLADGRYTDCASGESAPLNPFALPDALPLTAAGKPDKQKIREVLARWARA